MQEFFKIDSDKSEFRTVVAVLEDMVMNDFCNAPTSLFPQDVTDFKFFMTLVITDSPLRANVQSFHRDQNTKKVINLIVPLAEGYTLDIVVEGSPVRFSVPKGSAICFCDEYRRGTETIAPRLHIRVECCDYPEYSWTTNALTYDMPLEEEKLLTELPLQEYNGDPLITLGSLYSFDKVERGTYFITMVPEDTEKTANCVIRLSPKRPRRKLEIEVRRFFNPTDELFSTWESNGICALIAVHNVILYEQSEKKSSFNRFKHRRTFADLTERNELLSSIMAFKKDWDRENDIKSSVRFEKLEAMKESKTLSVAQK